MRALLVVDSDMQDSGEAPWLLQVAFLKLTEGSHLHMQLIPTNEMLVLRLQLDPSCIYKTM